ncbi:hypothetical protein GCM10020358_55800 [Amorphoplanes nipponensis]|uniref:Uncharacterized protein n=1 Tax=Actinoplanes nipponensis TaxID=135950 RepID=A0A919JJX8_9ACTN|nr:hypothetical protein [Actinoplanes nipponensis]GIE51926.1 hypothetical protein Ani05nite_54600 [Actinoplanes nipponensis]
MDRLDRLLSTAAPLLRRVDDILATAGAPPAHPVWTELRRVRLLPGDAARAVAALRPYDLADAGPELRADARAYAVLAASLPAPGEWSGEAADAYDTARQRTADHLSGGPDSLDERLQASADLADSLVAWMRSARDSLAGTLAEVLTSSEAVTLAGTGTDPAAVREQQAAAEVAARVLRTVAESCACGAEVLHGSGRLAEPVGLPG